jgi:hypothetical protein
MDREKSVNVRALEAAALRKAHDDIQRDRHLLKKRTSEFDYSAPNVVPRAQALMDEIRTCEERVDALNKTLDVFETKVKEVMSSVGIAGTQ